jgi:hypothetical protein
MTKEQMELYAAVGRGETVQFEGSSDWIAWSPDKSIALGGLNWDWRIKPKNITITIELPEPMRVAPAMGTTYFCATPTNIALHFADVWTNHALDRDFLNKGCCFATKEQAIEASKAFILALGGKV